MKRRVLTGVVALCLGVGGLVADDKTKPDYEVDVRPHGPVGLCKCKGADTGKRLLFQVNAKDGEFEPNSGDVLSGKSHNGSYWAPKKGENKKDHFTAESPAVKEGESSYVLCGGRWLINHQGKGKSGNDVIPGWLAELAEQGHVRVFLCHQCPNQLPMQGVASNKDIFDGVGYEAKRYGSVGQNCIIVKIGVGNPSNVKNIYQVDNIYKIKSLLEEKSVKENSVIALYSVGHGNAGQLGVGYTNGETDIRSILNAYSGIDASKFACLSHKYTEQFEKFLMKGSATVFLQHCWSGTPTQKGSMVDAIAEALSYKFVVVGHTGKSGVGAGFFGPHDNPKKTDPKAGYTFFVPEKPKK